MKWTMKARRLSMNGPPGCRWLRSTALPLRLYSPRLAQPLDEAHHYVKYETALGVRLTEVAVLVASRETDCQFEWTNWEVHGHNPGDPRYIEPAIVDIVKYDKPVDGPGREGNRHHQFRARTLRPEKSFLRKPSRMPCACSALAASWT